jgi:hypothetical protein
MARSFAIRPDLALSTAFSDIRHSQRLLVILIVGSWYQSGYLAPRVPGTSGAPISRLGFAREVGGDSQ